MRCHLYYMVLIRCSVSKADEESYKSERVFTLSQFVYVCVMCKNIDKGICEFFFYDSESI